MKVKIERSVVVITPTIGNKTLPDAIQSVSNQTYKNIKHLVVVDGPDYWMKVLALPIPDEHKIKNFQIVVAPENTGGVPPGYYGHRIYAAYPHLVNSDYIAFLDSDNWWEENHIESLIDKIESDNLDWAYSLRNVYLNDVFYDKDCCESIGKYPIWFSDPETPQHLVDSSSYCFKREFIVKTCGYWHSSWGGDRRFYQIITQKLGHNNFDTTGQHTLNYRLPDMDRFYGGQMDFFKKGNDAILKKYGGVYPWQTAT